MNPILGATAIAECGGSLLIHPSNLQREPMKNLQTILAAGRSVRVSSSQVTNRAGAPAFRRSLQEQVVQVLSTGTLSDTFYATREELAKEALQVLTEARDTIPSFLARALVWAREEGLMKSLPVLGLVVLSSAGARTRELFENAFPRVVKTPDDLRSFAEIAKSGAIHGRKGLGGMAVKAVRSHLEGMSEYHALKYGSAASRGITLGDLVKLAHPKPATAEASERFGWLIRGSEALGLNLASNSQIRALESLKKATTEMEAIALIRQGRLPFEVVVPSLKETSTAIWSELLRQAPYFNLLRNLATFTRHGVFQSEENVALAVAKLTNPGAVEHSKVLPFRFFDAYRQYVSIENGDSRIANALREALELSFVNMPSFGDRKVAIGTDVSGSMNDPITPEGETRFIDIAGVFTGALLKRIEGRAIPLPFDTEIRRNHSLSSRDDVMVTAGKISSYGGGGTAVGAPIQELLDRKIKVDAFIGITDNEDWSYGQGHSVRGSFLDLWREYRQQIAPCAKAYLVTIAPYRDAVAPSGEHGVRFIYGWSDRALRFIGLDLESGESQVRVIEQMDLKVAKGSQGVS